MLINFRQGGNVSLFFKFWSVTSTCYSVKLELIPAKIAPLLVRILKHLPFHDTHGPNLAPDNTSDVSFPPQDNVTTL
jgi:hypothetical protein